MEWTLEARSRLGTQLRYSHDPADGSRGRYLRTRGVSRYTMSVIYLRFFRPIFRPSRPMFLNSCNRFQKVVLSQWARVNSTLGLWHDINFKRESLNKVINNERTTYVCHLPSFIWLLLYCMSIFDGYAFDSLQFSKNNRLIILFFVRCTPV